MSEKNDKIKHADLPPVIPSRGRKSAGTVSVLSKNQIIDADARQVARNRIEPRVCADVVSA